MPRIKAALKAKVNVALISIAAFVILQWLISPLFPDDYKTLWPRIRTSMTFTHDPKGPEGNGVLGMEGTQVSTTDEQGYRVNPRVKYGEKAPATRRIFAIGGSTTEQILIGDENTWTHRLQESLKREPGGAFEVVNTGLAGLRARHHLSTLKHVLRLQARHKPDAVLFLMGANDWNYQAEIRFGTKPPDDWRAYWEWSNTLLGRFVNAMTRSVSPGNAGAERDIGSWVRDANFHERGENSLARAQVRPFRPDRVYASFDESLNAILSVCKSQRLRCIFMTQPHAYSPQTPEVLRRKFWMTPCIQDYTLDLDSLIHLATLYNRTLSSLVREAGFPVCDLAAALPPTPQVFSDDVHFNLAGSARVAELVHGCIKGTFQ